MRTNGICLAENSVKTFLHRGGRLHKAKLRLAPYLLAGGLLLSGINGLKGQELKTDTVSIGEEQQTNLAEQKERDKDGTWLALSVFLLVYGGAYIWAKHSKNVGPTLDKDEMYIDPY